MSRAHQRVDDLSDQPITKADLLSWAKVAAIVGPLLVAIVGAAIKLSSDANAIRTDVDQLKSTVAEHSRVIDDLRGVGALVNRLSVQVDRFVEASEAQRLTQMQLDERIKAQDARVQLFWGQTWPTMEARLKRIEDKLDRSGR